MPLKKSASSARDAKGKRGKKSTLEVESTNKYVRAVSEFERKVGFG